MKLKINSIGSDAIQAQIDGEDYSVADILHKELLNVKHVKFAGVAPPHPLIKTLTIQVHTDGAEANELLNDAVEKAQTKLSELLHIAREIFPDATRPALQSSPSRGTPGKMERVSTDSVEPPATAAEATTNGSPAASSEQQSEQSPSEGRPESV